MLIMFKKL